ncbi:hypothetical protein [Rhodothermus marinus]|uniref:hypothetical protein n=1 Tax=Rhodothermus marinus TaxID=29549 RepID=UPI000A45A304|nr:hypothetical protein [Rhodothermus marinus]
MLRGKGWITVWLGCLLSGVMAVQAQQIEGLVPRFERPTGRLVLARPTQAGAFLDVVGRRAALLGYEHRAFEVWGYPLKILRDLRLEFQIADYPVPLSGEETLAYIEARPEATVLTYSHAAFTVRQILYAPVHEPGIVMLLDVQAVRPLTIRVAFRPDLRLMWPAGLMTGYLGWNEEGHFYTITEETRRFAGVIGSPLARDVSVQPYQEEPKDLPNRFELEVTPELAARYYIPVVITGSVEGIDGAIATYRRLLEQAESYYRQNVAHYERLLDEALQIETPDPTLNTAYAWALVGIDKGWRPTRIWAPDWWPASARRATASGPALPGSSDAMRSGPCWPRRPSDTSKPLVRRWTSCESFSGKTVRSRTRSPRVPR